MSQARYKDGETAGDKYDAFIFIKGSNYVFTKEYLIHYSEFMERGIDRALEGYGYISHLGNSSFSFKMTLKDATSDTIYGKFDLCYVRVGPETRRPLPFNDHFKGSFHNMIPNENVATVKLPPVPNDGNMSWYEETIVIDFIDFNKHTNIRFYELFAMKGIVKGILDGTFEGDRNIKDLGDINVKERNMLFIRESVQGDVLKIGSWQDKYNKNIFYTVVMNQDINIVEVRFELHGQFAGSSKM